MSFQSYIFTIIPKMLCIWLTCICKIRIYNYNSGNHTRLLICLLIPPLAKQTTNCLFCLVIYFTISLIKNKFCFVFFMVAKCLYICLREDYTSETFILSFKTSQPILKQNTSALNNDIRYLCLQSLLSGMISKGKRSSILGSKVKLMEQVPGELYCMAICHGSDSMIEVPLKTLESFLEIDVKMEPFMQQCALPPLRAATASLEEQFSVLLKEEVCL